MTVDSEPSHRKRSPLPFRAGLLNCCTAKRLPFIKSVDISPPNGGITFQGGSR